MKKVRFHHGITGRAAGLCLALVSLSLLSASVKAAISADCRGSQHCSGDIKIDANTPDYINVKHPVHFHDNVELTVSASKVFDDAGVTTTFRDNTLVNINASRGISAGTYSLQGAKKPDQHVIINVNATEGIYNSKILAQNSNPSIVNANKKSAIGQSDLVFNKGTTLNINASYAVVDSKSLTLTDAVINLTAPDAFTATSMAAKKAVSLKGASVLNVSALQGMSGGTVNIQDSSVVNVNATGGIRGGILVLKQSAVLNASATHSINGPTDNSNRQIFNNNAEMNVNAIHALNGGNQIFNNDAILNINAEQGVAGGYQTFDNDSILNAKADNAIIDGKMSFKGRAQLNATGANTISGGTQDFYSDSVLNANGANTLAGGVQVFRDNSTLYANHAGSLSDNSKQIFQTRAVLNLNAADALNGGNQIFNDHSVLNINESQGISGGYQIFSLNSVLNAKAEQAITDGQMQFKDNAVLNATGNNTISGGTQNFLDASVLNADGGNTLSGGNQNFNDSAVLNAYSSGSITGTARQTFAGNSLLNANVSDAINGGGSVAFKDNAVLNVRAMNAITNGNLLFDGDSQLNINAEQGISGGKQRFKGNSRINLNAAQSVIDNTTITLEGNAGIVINHDDALNFTDNIVFQKTYDTSSGGVLDVNGHSLRIGKITDNGNVANIVNHHDNNAVLTSGLYDYNLLSGHSYKYNDLMRNAIMRPDAVVSSTLGDIIRQADMALLPPFADQLIPQTNAITQTGQGVWLHAAFIQQSGKGEGVSHAGWQSDLQKIQIASELFPADEDNPNKLGVYLGYLSGRATITGRTLYSAAGNLGSYRFSLYGAGLYWRYLAAQGWYTNTAVQLSRYTSNVMAVNSINKPDTHGNAAGVSFETAYPLALTESITLLPRLQLTWQNLNMANYKFADLQVTNSPDKQLTASAAARIYWEHMTISGAHWQPYLDIEVLDRLAARDRNQLQIISIDHTESLLTSYAQVSLNLTGGVAVKLNDFSSYYVNVGYRNILANGANTWHGSVGISVNW